MERELGGFRHGADQEQEADGGDDGAALGQLVQALEESLVVHHPQVEEDQEGGKDHADVADGVHHECLAAGEHRGGALVPEADQ